MKEKYPYVSLLLPLLLGILVGSVLEVESWRFDAVFVLSITLVVAIFSMHGLHGKQFGDLATNFRILFSLYLFLLGFLLVQSTHPQVEKTHFSNYSNTYLYGWAADEPHFREGRVRFSFLVTGGIDMDTLKPYTGRISLSIQLNDELHQEEWYDRIRYGTLLMIPANYQIVAPPRNPGELDYAAHLEKRDCWHQAFIPVDQIKILAQDQGGFFMTKAIILRKKMVQKFNRYVMDEHAQAIASTLILGYRADLSQEMLQIYSATGTIHVLSVSGMHVVIVFWLLSMLLSWMDHRPHLQRLKFPVLLFFIWGYALVTGFSPSVLRAAIMLSFVIWAREVGKQARIYNSIAASAFFILLFHPKFLLDIGFQLSYLAVLSIVYLQPILRIWVVTRIKWLKPIADYSVMSIAAQAGAFPLATYYFNQFPLYFLLANLIIVLPATGIMYAGFALLLCPPGVVASWFGFVLEWLILSMNHMLKLVLYLPYASLTGLNISLLTCVLLYAWMLSLSISISIRSRFFFGLSWIALLFLSLSGTQSSWIKRNTNEIVIHNVRQAVAISINSDNKYWLISDLDHLSRSSIQYSVMPYAKAHTSEKNMKLIHTGIEYAENNLYVSSQVIQYGNKRLVIWDQPRNSEGMVLSCDVLLIRNNPRQPLQQILARHPSVAVVVDGSNNWRTVERLQQEGEELGVQLYILKDNYAYFWKLSTEHE